MIDIKVTEGEFIAIMRSVNLAICRMKDQSGHQEQAYYEDLYSKLINISDEVINKESEDQLTNYKSTNCTISISALTPLKKSNRL